MHAVRWLRPGFAPASGCVALNIRRTLRRGPTHKLASSIRHVLDKAPTGPCNMRPGGRRSGAGAPAPGSHQDPSPLWPPAPPSLPGSAPPHGHKKAALRPGIAATFPAGRKGRMRDTGSCHLSALSYVETVACRLLLLALHDWATPRGACTSRDRALGKVSSHHAHCGPGPHGVLWGEGGEGSWRGSQLPATRPPPLTSLEPCTSQLLSVLRPTNLPLARISTQFRPTMQPPLTAVGPAHLPPVHAPRCHLPSFNVQTPSPPWPKPPHSSPSLIKGSPDSSG